jgi:potassium efflux system protein
VWRSAVLLALVLALDFGAAAAPPAPPKGAEGGAGQAEAEPAPEPSIARFDKQEFDLGRALESARLDLSSAERRFSGAQARLDAAAEPGEALREEVAARRLELSTRQRIVSLLEEQLERTRKSRESLARLQRLDREAVPPASLEEWAGEARARNSELERQERLVQDRLSELRQELSFTRERQKQAASGPVARWLGQQSEVLGELVAQYEKDLQDLRQAEALSGRLLSAVERREQELSLGQRLQGLLHRARSIWSYPLTGSSEEAITVGKIVSALVIFVLGWAIAAALSRALGTRLFPRVGLDAGAASAFQSLAFYFLLFIAFLTALRTVNIPLTAFAVVGGALAIGVGFGSQTVVNNFISGLILLLERPIRIGDLIEVDGTYGVVERIGLRSTRVRSGDNVHIIVPNGSFLEGKVINWTHNDPTVRVRISVGVVYGSPTREVARLIHRALDEHPAVLKSPEPVVLFTEFGDNSLNFDVRFWIRMHNVMDRLRVESDLRYAIDDLFREAGIVIAFPQRDVHLDSNSPVEVRLVGGSGADGAGREGS